jgi:hypothetical protein
MPEILGQETEIVRPLIREGILVALDNVAAIIDLNDTVEGLSSVYVVERSLEELPLPGRS